MKIHVSRFAAFVMAFLFTAALHAQKTTYYDMHFNKCKEKVAYYYRVVTKEGNRFLVKDYFYSNNQLQMEGYYMNKKLTSDSRVGMFTFYYKNGQKSSQGEYVNGRNNGKWSGWFADGQLKYEGSYDNDNKEGEWTYFHRNGTLKLKINYKNGEREGHFIYYFDDGSKEEEVDFVKGRKDGKYTLYFKGSGKVKITKSYLKDSLDGPYEEYWPDGKLAIKGNYSDNKADGTFEFYHANGNLSCQAEYKKNKFVKGTFFDEEGKKLNKKVTEEDLISPCEYPGGDEEMRKLITQKLVDRADVKGALNAKYEYFFEVKLTIDPEGNIIETEWTSPDEDDDSFEDDFMFKKFISVAIEDFPKFKPAKKYNRFYNSYYYVQYYIKMKK